MAGVERHRAAARQVASIAGCIGLIALIGWVFGVAALTRILPGLTSMKVNTALGVLLLAVAWWLPRRAAAPALGVVLVIGVGTLVEHAGPDLHLDNLLIQAPTHTAHPGRMAIATASCLALLAAAELAVVCGRRRLVATAALISLGCASLMLTSYLYGLHALYTVGPFSTVALPTAFALALLSVAVLLGMDDSRLWWALVGRDAGAALLRAVLPWTLVGVPVLGYLRELGQRAGWYGTSFGLAVMVTTSALVLALVLFQAARRLAVTDSDRLAAIAELRALNDDLDDRVAERTRALERERADLQAAEAAARTAQQDAERADAAKDLFLSRMSHELRTPLNAVLGFAQLLELDGLPPRQDESVRHILRGGRHLLAMINDVLDITGINADRLELSPEPLPVAELITDALSLMAPVATAAS